MPCMERIAIAMQDGGAGAGARAASQPHFVLPPNLYNEPPGRGDFLVSNFHPGLIPGNLVLTISGQGGCWCGMGWPVFGLPPFGKNASSSREIDAASVNLLQKRADALMVSPDPLFDSRRVQLVTLATHHRLPTVYPFKC